MVREGLSLLPLIPGGAQEQRRRGGTEPVAAIAGFGAAAQSAGTRLQAETSRLTRLRARIETRLRALYPEVRFFGEGAPRLCNTVHLALPGVSGEMLVIALDLAGVSASTGSACASGAVEPSHVLRAMGLAPHEAKEALRLSLGWSSTEEEVDRFLSLMPGIVAQVRASQPAAS
jgi:cysteine desulfurase